MQHSFQKGFSIYMDGGLF